MTLPSSFRILPEGSYGEIKLRQYSKDPWGPENMREIRRAWELTDEQEEQLWELQRRLSDVDHFKNEPETILKFMVAPTGFDAAEGLFRTMLEWRLENNVDTLLQDYRPPPKLIENAHATILRGADKDGDPIFVERGGALDAAAVLEEYGREEALKCGIWIRELHTRGAWIDEFEQKKGMKIKGVTVVYDLKGLSSKHLNRKVLDLFGELMKITQNFYPGPIKRMIIIRSPSIFPYVWAIAKNCIRKSARDKMVFPSCKTYLKVLDQYIDRHVLPECIAEGGCGAAAYGLPNLIGDDSPNPWWSSPTSKMNKVAFGSTEIYQVSALSLDETEEGSLTSSDDCSVSSVSVSGSAIVKGHWEDRIGGGSQIFNIGKSKNNISIIIFYW